jgi:hypothetical protein
MSKVENELAMAVERLSVAAANVTLIACVLVETRRADVFDALRLACDEMREAEGAVCEAEQALVVNMIGERIEGAGEGGMVS